MKITMNLIMLLIPKLLAARIPLNRLEKRMPNPGTFGRTTLARTVDNGIPSEVVIRLRDPNIPDDVSGLSDIWIPAFKHGNTVPAEVRIPSNQPVRSGEQPKSSASLELLSLVRFVRKEKQNVPISKDLDHMIYLRKSKLGGNDGKDASRTIAEYIEDKDGAISEAMRRAAMATDEGDKKLWTEIANDISQKKRLNENVNDISHSLEGGNTVPAEVQIPSNQPVRSGEQPKSSASLELLSLIRFVRKEKQNVPISKDLDHMIYLRKSKTGGNDGKDASRTIAEYIEDKDGAISEAMRRAAMATDEGDKKLWTEIANDISNQKM